MKGHKLVPILAVLIVLLSAGGQASAQSKFEIVPGEIIVGIRPVSDVPTRAAGVASTVGTIVESNRNLHFYRVRFSRSWSMAGAIASLKKRSDVLYAEPNYVMHADATPNDTYYSSQQYGPQKVQANLAWDIWNPTAQTVIAIVDTGIDYTHPDLTNKITRDGSGNVIGYNAVGSNGHSGNPNDPADDYGHGTHCAGIAAAETNNGTGIAGIAGWNGLSGSDTANTKLMPVKVLDSSGSGTSTTVANGITWAADHGAKVISLSLGGGGSTTMSNAVAYAWSKGCLVVASAGNSGSSGFSYPAAYANVISVAATDKTDTLTYYSNYGSWVLVAAPGGGNTAGDYIWSTTPTYTAGGGFALNYDGLSGTSMACPHVSGEAALIWSQNPTLTNAQVKSLILSNVDPYNPYSGHTIASGAGRINVYRALVAAGGGTPTIPAPPTGLTATAGNGQIGLVWNASAGATSYNVKRGLSSGGSYTTVGTPSGTSFTDTAVVNGTTYYYVVTAVNSAGESGNSNEASATPQAPAGPAAPTNLRTIGIFRNEIDIAWNDNSNNETGFRVEISTNGTAFTDLGSVGANSTAAAITGLTRHTKYWFRVRAYNAGGYSPYTNVVSATTR
jgi:thermitase